MDLCQVDCATYLFSSDMVSKRETSHIRHTSTKHYSGRQIHLQFIEDLRSHLGKSSQKYQWPCRKYLEEIYKRSNQHLF